MRMVTTDIQGERPTNATRQPPMGPGDDAGRRALGRIRGLQSKPRSYLQGENTAGDPKKKLDTLSDPSWAEWGGASSVLLARQ